MSEERECESIVDLIEDRVDPEGEYQQELVRACEQFFDEWIAELRAR